MVDEMPLSENSCPQVFFWHFVQWWWIFKNWNICNVLQKGGSWHQYEIIPVFLSKSSLSSLSSLKSTLILNLSRIHTANRANHPFKSGYLVSLAIFPQRPLAKTEQTRIWATEAIVHWVHFHEHACVITLTEWREKQRFSTTGLM